MYLDSMGNSKPKAFQLLKIYLNLERKDKEAKGKEAKGTAGKSRKVEGASSTSIAASPTASPTAASAAPPATTS